MTTGLAGRGIPFQAVGGLAVRAWGGRRDLVDLDLYIPDADLAGAAQCLGDWRAVEPCRVRSAHWDVEVAVLEIDGCRVELGGGDSARYRVGGTGEWQPAGVRFEAGVRRAVLGVPLPVMPLDQLVAYKTALQREVDQVDLHLLLGSGGPVETRLAAYGTLVPGRANHGMVADLRGTWTPGHVHGVTHPAGWGMTHGYPALVWRPDANPVPVHLLTSPDLPAAWGRLDQFEGEAYRRITVPVTTAEGRVLANLYTARAVA